MTEELYEQLFHKKATQTKQPAEQAQQSSKGPQEQVNQEQMPIKVPLVIPTTEEILENHDEVQQARMVFRRTRI